MQIGRQGERMFVLNDGNNNVVGLTGPTGAMLEQYTYEPYGALIRAESLAAHPVNKLGHQGLFFDHFVASTDGRILVPETTGLYYNRNRHYSPTIGRFLQRDPNETAQPLLAALLCNGAVPSIGGTSASISALYGDGMNLYQYLGGNPTNNNDPLGLFSVLELGQTMGLQGLLQGLMSGVISKATGGSFGQGFVGGAIGGALGGAGGYFANLAFGASASSVWATLAAHSFTGAVDGSISAFGETFYSTRDLGAALSDAAVGGILGAATGGIMSIPGIRNLFIPKRVVEIFDELKARAFRPLGIKNLKGGRRWVNSKNQLPPGGTYLEFDVDVKVKGSPRSAHRIVVDVNSGQGWYTPDVYKTFIAIQR